MNWTRHPDPARCVGAVRVTKLSTPRATARASLGPPSPIVWTDLVRHSLSAVLAAWGNKGGPEDLDGNGTVDFDDLLILLAAWGPCE